MNKTRLVIILLICVICGSLILGAKSCIGRNNRTNSGSSIPTTRWSLPAPSRLTAVPVSTSIDLQWFYNSSAADGFEIWRSPENGNYTLISTLDANTTSYSDRDVALFVLYYYYIVAFDTIGDRSAWSNVVSASSTSGAGWQAIAAGESHSLALNADGTLWGWGSNQQGQLSPGATVFTIPITSPTLLSPDRDWSRIAAGQYDTLAIKTNGTLWQWGDNLFGELGVGDNNNYYTLMPVGTDSNWSVIAGGGFHSMALKTNGTLWSWGANYYGQLGLGVGDTIDRYTPTQVGTESDWVIISPGYAHTLGVKTDGILWAWGFDSWRQLGDNQANTYSPFPIQVLGASNWLAVSASYIETLACKTDGTLWMWGRGNNAFTVSNDTDWAAVAIGRTNGISSGTYIALLYYLALKTNKTLWSWGGNTDGELGLGDTNGRGIPTSIGAESDWSKIAAGTWHNLGLKTNGTLWVWGGNEYNQLGTGDTIDRYLPCLLGSPAPPTNLTATVIPSSQINLSWSDNSNNASGFKIGRSTDGVNYSLLPTLNANITSYSDTGLILGTTYYYRIRTYNAFGDSPYSDTNATTPGLPSALIATAISSSQLNLSWSIDIPTPVGIDGFELDRSTDGVNWSLLPTLNANITSYSDTGLILDTTYYYRIRTYNAFGDSPYFGGASAIPRLLAPSSLTITPVSSSQINLGWKDNSPDEQGFKIERSYNGPGSYVQIGTVGADVISFPDTAVTSGNTYYYRVRAFTDFGNSAYSNEAYPSIPAPSSLTLTCNTTPPPKIDLLWIDNSNSQAGFKIERSYGGPGSYVQIGTVGAGVISFPDTAVTSGNIYYYRIRAFNDFVNSPYSNEAYPYISAPSSLTLTVVSSTQISLSWADVSGGLGYKIERSFTPSVRPFVGNFPISYASGMSTMGYRFRPLINGQITALGRYRPGMGGGNTTVSLWNDGGGAAIVTATVSSSGGWQWATLATPVTVTAGTYYRVGVDCSSWYCYSSYAFPVTKTNIYIDSSVSTAGGIFGFPNNIATDQMSGWADIEFRADPYIQIAATAIGVVTYTDTVTPGITYYYRVRAYNTFVDSGYSPEANATTTPPSTPTALTAITISSTQINLSWTNVANEIGYKIERGFASGGPYTQIATTATDAVTYNDTVTPSNTYYYRVRAYNGCGNSGYSPEANANTVPPSAPTALTATMISSTQINLSWTAVTNTTGYKIERKLGANGTYARIDIAERPLSNDIPPSSEASWLIYTMGYRFKPLIDGQITALGRYNPVRGNTTVKVWSDGGGTLIAMATVSSASGWQWATLATPVNVTAGTYYVVNITCDTYYGYDSSYTFPVTKTNIYIASSVFGAFDGYPNEISTSTMYGWADIEFVPTVDMLTYNDITVTPGNTYFYRVRAYNVSGDSAPSPEANATTP